VPAPYSWYLVRTKSKRENYVRDQLSRILPEAFLPMVKPVPLRDSSVVQLFLQYIFARLDLSAHYFEVRYMPGVTGFV
jgi:transcription antitermination factor NusG